MSPLRHIYLIVVAIAVFGMATLTFVDVIGRYFLNAPIPGSFEIVGLILGIAMIGAFPLVSFRERHITVGLFDGFIRGGARLFRNFIVRLGTAATAGFMAERLYAAALDEWANDFVTENLGITRAPLLIVMAVVCAATAVGMLIIAFRDYRREAAAKESVD
ncbi:MAG: TRAP transporter small permease [Alphaproteobacteria bacterium]